MGKERTCSEPLRLSFCDEVVWAEEEEAIEIESGFPEIGFFRQIDHYNIIKPCSGIVEGGGIGGCGIMRINLWHMHYTTLRSHPSIEEEHRAEDSYCGSHCRELLLSNLKDIIECARCSE